MTADHAAGGNASPSAPKGPVSPHRHRRAGFTIMELWVVMLVLVFIAGMSLAAFRGKTKRSTLQRSRGSIAADLRLMREYALSGKTVSVCNTTVKTICPSNGSCTCVNEVPSGGFGAYFKTCAQKTRCPYYLFADLDADGTFSLTRDLDHNGVPDELLSNGERVMEYPTIVSSLVAKYPSSSRSDTYGEVIFTAYSGSATLDGSSSCCGGSSAGGGIEYRTSEELTIGPSVGTSVKLIIKGGGAGIQEQN
ncbi:MAG: hypothetical protein PHI63_00570 [Patescibacteria group bacterium]|nr:hypothetical protein [Patescibacteria group bacterium]